MPTCQATLTSDTNLISHDHQYPPRDLHYYTLLHKELVALENLFIESPSTDLHNDQGTASATVSLNAATKERPADSSNTEETPNFSSSKILNMDVSETPSARIANMEETSSSSSTIVKEESSSGANALLLQGAIQSKNESSSGAPGTMASRLNSKKASNKKKAPMLESVQRGPKDLKRSKRSSSKRSLRLQLRKDEQKNTIRTLRYSDPVVNVRDLLLKYGGSFNLMAQDWSKLDRELLSLKEERYLASLMKPFKVLSSLLLLLLLSSSFKLNQTLI